MAAAVVLVVGLDAALVVGWAVELVVGTTELVAAEEVPSVRCLPLINTYLRATDQKIADVDEELSADIRIS